MNFNPFKNRLSRDIRNTIGTALIRSIKKGTADPFFQAARFFSSKPLTLDMEKYISQRKEQLESILDHLKKNEPQAAGFFQILMLLWNQNLYFEAHEWLEEEWFTRTGDEKKGFQALIQAAVALEHFEYKRMVPAKKLAKRAAEKLETFSKCIPEPLDSQMFIDAMNRILGS